MVLLPAPAGPSIAITSLRVGSFILSRSPVEWWPGAHWPRVWRGFRWNRRERAWCTASAWPSCNRLAGTHQSPRSGHRGLGRRNVQHGARADVGKLELTCRQQRIDRLSHPAATDEGAEKLLHLQLLGGNHAFNVFGDQRGQRLGDGHVHAFAHFARDTSAAARPSTRPARRGNPRG